MKKLLPLALAVAALLGTIGWVSLAGAQAVPGGSRAAAERAAVDAAWQGAERHLNIDFSGRTPQQWNVSGWSWSGY